MSPFNISSIQFQLPAWANTLLSTPSFSPQNFSNTPDPDIFNVQSNSTITALAFDSQKQELSFSVSGQSGTTGYANVSVAKNFLASIDNLKVFLDGNQIDRKIISNETSWLITFYYSHSMHQVKIDFSPAASFGVTLAGWILAVVILAVLAGAFAGVLVHRKKHGLAGKSTP